MRLLILLLVLVTEALAAAQAPPPALPAQPPLEAAPTPPVNYTYTSEGRRDPFVSLINRGTSDGRTSKPSLAERAEGLAGVLVEEATVRGILKTPAGWVAVLGAPNGRTYTARAAAKLMDGFVREITPTVVVFMQEVNDPLSLEKQREVRKPLRGEVK